MLRRDTKLYETETIEVIIYTALQSYDFDENMPNLTTFELRLEDQHQRDLDDMNEDFEMINENLMKYLSRMKSLQTVVIDMFIEYEFNDSNDDSLHAITVDGIWSVIENCENIKRIELNGESNLTQQSMNDLLTRFKNIRRKKFEFELICHCEGNGRRVKVVSDGNECQIIS